MRVRVDCYGASARWCGGAAIELEVGEDASAGTVLEQLSSRFPEVAARRTGIAVARGEEIIPPSTPLAPGDRIALIPPVSGG